MPLLTVEEFREFHVTRSATAILPEILKECLDAASDSISDLCRADVITSAIGDETNAFAATRKIRRAQRKLAYRELLEFMSSRSRDGGIVETERDSNGDTTNKYISFAEVRARRADLQTEAIALLEPYLTPTQPGGSGTNKKRISHVPIVVEC